MNTWNPFEAAIAGRALRTATLLATAACATAGPVGDPGLYGTPSEGAWTLWYRQPAAAWVEALPVGNGRIGAIVFGSTGRERIQINDETVWAGRRQDDNNPLALTYLDSIRGLVFAGRNVEATELATRALVAKPPTIRSYQVLMDLWLDPAQSGEATEYHRELDIRDGIARTRYRIGDVLYEREVFASAPDDVLVVRLTADRPNSVTTTLALTRPQDHGVRALSDRDLLLSGQIIDPPTAHQGPGGPALRFAGQVRVHADGGTVRSVSDTTLAVEGADAVTLLITSATDYDLDRLDLNRSLDPVAEVSRRLDVLGTPAYPALRARHVADHRPRMERVQLMLGEAAEPDTVPTDVRLERVREGGEDAHLVALHFQFGRYLLLGSSRAPGILPANLQGIWNEHIDAPWQSDFHTNINLQMNYFPAEVTNLAETVEPLVGFLDRLREPGRETARKMYGAAGWTMHHVTNPFGRTSLADAIRWGTFPMAAAWMTQHVWEHYAFSRDLDYLRDTAYPIMKEAAEFVLDFLVESPEGYLVTTPSYSPENAFIHPQTGEAVQLTYAPTMDVQIALDLFENTVEAAEALRVDEEFRDRLRRTMERLPPVRINRHGAIQEWIHDYEEAEPGHRHISHLFGLHPGRSIHPGTPELFTAARRTLDRRLAHGGGHTGWSRAWIINFYARLLDGEEAYHHVVELLRRSTYPSLFGDHPPFQIDANFGGTAGVAEMLLQSHAGVVHLLPAIPTAWPDGSVTGLRARGGYLVDLAWRGGTLAESRITVARAGEIRVRTDAPVRVFRNGRVVPSRVDDDGAITFAAEAGAAYLLKP